MHKLKEMAGAIHYPGLTADSKTVLELLGREDTSVLLGGRKIADVMKEFMQFLNGSHGRVGTYASDYLACELAYGAQMSTEALTAVCAGQDSGYEGDLFISTFWRHKEYLTGSPSMNTRKERHTSYSVIFRRLIDDHRGHAFEIAGILEATTRRNVNARKSIHGQTFNAFLLNKDGSWRTGKGTSRQIRDYILQRDQ